MNAGLSLSPPTARIAADREKRKKSISGLQVLNTYWCLENAVDGVESELVSLSLMSMRSMRPFSMV
jgi:hypothetical protein